MLRQHASRVAMLAILLAGSGFLLAAAKASDDAQTDTKKLEGAWRCSRAEERGRLVPGVVSKGQGMVIEGEEIQFLYGGNSKGAKGTFSVDPSKNPKEIEIEYTRGSEIGKKRLGIYKLTGDKLEIAWGELDSKKRPKKFTTKPGLGTAEVYGTFTREKE